MGFNKGKKSPYNLISDAEMDQLIQSMPSDMMSGLRQLEKRIHDPKLSRDELEDIQGECLSYIERSQFYKDKLGEHLGRLKTSGDHIRKLGMADQFLDRLGRSKEDPMPFKSCFPLPKGFVWTAPEPVSHYTPRSVPVSDVSEGPTIDETIAAGVVPPEPGLSEVIDEMPIIERTSEHDRLANQIPDLEPELQDYVPTPMPDIPEETVETTVDELPPESNDIDSLDLQVDDFELEQDQDLAIEEEKLAPFKERAQKEADRSRLEKRQDRVQDYIEQDQSGGSTISVQEGFEDAEEEDER